MSSLTRDGTAEPVSRDQILRHVRGQGWNIHFPCSADHEQDWQPYPVDPYSAICDDHIYILVVRFEVVSAGRFWALTVVMENSVVVFVFTLKTVLTSICLFPTLQGRETIFRGHKLTQNKVQKKKVRKTQRKSQHLRQKYGTDC